MQPLWTKESDEKANKWHEQQTRSPLGSTGSPGVCYILLQYRTLKTLLHSLIVVFGIITSDFGFWGEKGLFGKKPSKTDKDGLQLLPPLHPLDHNPKWNQETMFHPYVLPVFSCSSYFWLSLSCMFFLMENKSNYICLICNCGNKSFFHLLKSKQTLELHHTL